MRHYTTFKRHSETHQLGTTGGIVRQKVAHYPFSSFDVIDSISREEIDVTGQRDDVNKNHHQKNVHRAVQLQHLTVCHVNCFCMSPKSVFDIFYWLTPTPQCGALLFLSTDRRHQTRVSTKRISRGGNEIKDNVQK